MQELRRTCPRRCWQLIRVDESYEAVLGAASRVSVLLHPRVSHLDFNVGSAFWFVGRGIGFVAEDDPLETPVGSTLLRYGSDPRVDYSRTDFAPGCDSPVSIHASLASLVSQADVFFALHGWRQCLTAVNAGLSCIPPGAALPTYIDAFLRDYAVRMAPFVTAVGSTQVDASTLFADADVDTELDDSVRPAATSDRGAAGDDDSPVNGQAVVAKSDRNCAGLSVFDSRGCASPAHHSCIRGMCRACCRSTADTKSATAEKKQVVCSVHETKASKKAAAAAKPAEGSAGTCIRSASHQVDRRCLVRSAAKVLLVGIGADEALGGYGRHRTVFKHGSWLGLQRELAIDCGRLWIRNLGRDDRVWSDHGREVRSPFLDESVLSFIRLLPLPAICDLRLPPGVGDKRLLRIVASMLGLGASTTLVKRAIHFGSRIAKQSNVAAFGSNRAARGDAVFALPLSSGVGDGSACESQGGSRPLPPASASAVVL